MALATHSDTGPDLIANARAATTAMEALLADATRAISARVTEGGRISGKLLDREQRAAVRHRPARDGQVDCHRRPRVSVHR